MTRTPAWERGQRVPRAVPRHRRLAAAGSDLATVTNAVVVKYTVNATSNIICYGIGEGSFTNIAVAVQPKLGAQFNEVDKSINLFVALRSKVTSVQVDVAKGQLVLSLETCAILGFVNNDALVKFTFTVSVTPGLNVLTSTQSFLDFTFSPPTNQATFTVDDVYLIDPTSLAQVGLGTLATLTQYVKTTLGPQLAQGPAGPYPDWLPAMIASFPLPDHWNNQSGYNATFVGFDFETVTVNDAPSGYLFLVFGITSQMNPPECFCPGTGGAVPAMSPTPAHRAADTDPLLWSSVGISQQALTELAKPFVDTSHNFTKSKGGALYGTVQSNCMVHLKSVDVVSNGVRGDVQFTCGGSVSAALRALGQDVASATVGITITVNNASILWLPNVATDPKDPTKLDINLQPLLSMDDPIVTFTGSLVRPLDQFASWVLHVFVSALKDFLVVSVDLISYMLVFYTIQVGEPNEGFIKFDYVEIDYFPGLAPPPGLSIAIVGALHYQAPSS
jgi:hypothetical protein